MLQKLLRSILLQKDPAERRANIYRNIIRECAKMGGQLFGNVPEHGRREFFCLDEHTWVWHEEWTDEQSMRHTLTTRYDVRPNGILKAQDGQPYQPLTSEEAAHFYAAVRQYRNKFHERFDPLLAA